MARWEIQSLGDFLRRIALDYARYGYTRYVLRAIPPAKDPVVIDQKICTTYQVTTCRTARMRLKQRGIARVQYLRFRHAFVLLATEGRHATFVRLRSYDLRSAPLHFRGYSVGFNDAIVSVQVANTVWSRVEQHIKALTFEPRSVIEEAIAALPFYQFPGVVRQKYRLVQQVNRRRKRAGLLLVVFEPPKPKTPHYWNRRDHTSLTE